MRVNARRPSPEGRAGRRRRRAAEGRADGRAGRLPIQGPGSNAVAVGRAGTADHKHGLLLGKYDNPQIFLEGDFRRGVTHFTEPEFIERMKRAAAAMRTRFGQQPEPVLHAVIGALLTGNPTATVLLGQRNVKQAEAASKVGEALSEEDAAWVRSTYRRD